MKYKEFLKEKLTSNFLVFSSNFLVRKENNWNIKIFKEKIINKSYK
ncbi:hypothetical protein HMPREF1498_2358 [Fusobacterium sp. CM1]|nr:hypothetical protein HMPREF1498_2358 [Fusobacterium sp. CM1]